MDEVENNTPVTIETKYDSIKQGSLQEDKTRMSSINQTYKL